MKIRKVYEDYWSDLEDKAEKMLKYIKTQKNLIYEN